MTERKDFDEKDNASINGSNSPKLIKKVFGIKILVCIYQVNSLVSGMNIKT